VIEHAANASIDPQSRNKDSVIYHTEVKARQYKHALKANQAWVIDWTTVPPPDGGYPFTGADNAVRVIYVHHDESFRHIEVFWDGGKEIVEIALPAFTSVPKRKRDHDMDAKQPISGNACPSTPLLSPLLGKTLSSCSNSWLGGC